MKNKNIIFEELKEISPLIVQIRKTNVYSVSSSYFNDLSSKILKKIELSKENLHNLPSVTPYRIPTGYFENLSEGIFEKIYTDKEHSNEVFEETEAIAPILNKISKRHVYTIPANFFEKRQMPYFKVKKHESKIVPIYNRSKLIRFSAAAAIILFSIGVYTIVERNNTSSAAEDKAMNEVKSLSKEEIVHFLKTDLSSKNVTSTSRHTLKNENAIKSSLKDISDKEIQQFLIETGESDEI